MHKIVVCMGSSCFARGNKDNLRFIQEYIAENNLDADVNISGVLCNGNCGEGPNILIDEKWFDNISPTVLKDILDETFS